MDVLWHYPAILGLLKEGTIDRPQLQKLLHGATKDLCFDILQYAHWRTLNYRSCAATFSFRPPVTIAVPEVLATAIKVWDDWQERKLAKVSPRKAPHIRHPSRLYEQTEPAVYQGLVKAIDGTQSLRQMATARKQDLLLLTRSLRRYFASRSIELTTLPDLPIPIPEEPQSLTTIVAEETYLIVSIDDSKQTCDIMEEIITGGGHRFIGINDPARALPVLIEHKPDMIFLDLIMPSINGYELCGQIRRVSRLANVPIVILTGRDGIIDRVRAKMVGATGFLTKPVNRANIDRAIAQYLVAADMSSDQIN
jgi:chemotaxis family two-component system response regulator PixG